MSADHYLNRIDELLASLADHACCPKCGKWHQLHPRFGVARYTCCGQVYDVNLDPPGR